jgi:hypothetical protein
MSAGDDQIPFQVLQWVNSLPPENRELLRRHSEDRGLPDNVIALLQSGPMSAMYANWVEADDPGVSHMPKPIRDALARHTPK